MSYEPPMPPSELPTEIIDTLENYSSDRLRHVARYAEELAEYREREDYLAEDGDEDEIKERPDDRPNGVPSKATIKEMNDNRYYYWQWRDGDKIRSQYRSCSS